MTLSQANELSSLILEITNLLTNVPEESRDFSLETFSFDGILSVNFKICREEVDYILDKLKKYEPMKIESYNYMTTIKFIIKG